MKLAVIDVGTSSMRGILYGEDASILYSHQVKYKVQYLSETMAEQDPADWKGALYEIVRELNRWARERKLSIDGLSLTAQRSSVIPVDREGEPLRNARLANIRDLRFTMP